MPRVNRLVIQRLLEVSRVVVFTGAGVSAESGVPTFREAQTGLWATFDPEDLATPRAFQKNPKLVWEWYAWRRELVADATPNPAHQAIVEMEGLFSSFTLVTQNVDGLHQRAGSREVTELHGNIGRTKCSRDGAVVESWPEGSTIPPECPRCGALLRPDVVWFEEPLPDQPFDHAVKAIQECEVLFSIGTSAVVYPAAALPQQALRNGATVIEINPEPTPLTPNVSYFLQGKAGELLPGIVEAVRAGRATSR